jgi:hypothetical protein
MKRLSGKLLIPYRHTCKISPHLSTLGRLLMGITDTFWHLFDWLWKVDILGGCCPLLICRWYLASWYIINGALFIWNCNRLKWLKSLKEILLFRFKHRNHFISQDIYQWLLETELCLFVRFKSMIVCLTIPIHLSILEFTIHTLFHNGLYVIHCQLHRKLSQKCVKMQMPLTKKLNIRMFSHKVYSKYFNSDT